MRYEWEKEIDPSIRRTSLPRTPPQTQRGLSNKNVKSVKEQGETRKLSQGTATEIVNTLDEEEGQWQEIKTPQSSRNKASGENEEDSDVFTQSPIKKKRKRENKGDVKGGEPTAELSAMINAMERLTKKTEELKRQVRESTKTKIEIRTTTRELVNIVGILNRKMAVMKSSYEDLIAGQHERENLTKTAGDEAVKERKDMGTQANENDIKRELAQLRENQEKHIESQIEAQLGWKGLEGIIDCTWPAHCYKNTMEVEPKVLTNSTGDVAVILNPEETMTGEIPNALKTSFPDLTTLIEEGLKEGQLEYIKTNTETIMSRGRRGGTSRILYVLPYTVDKKGINDITRLYTIMEKLKEEAIAQGLARMRLVALRHMENDYLRKVAEYVFRGTEWKLEIIQPKDIKRTGVEPHIRVRTPTTEKIIIKSEGKQYADILRAIKSNVNIDQIGISVKTIKRTEKGDVMVEVQGGKKEAETLRKAITSKDESIRVQIRTQDTVVHILGIDGDVDKEEIERDIEKNTGCVKKGDVKVLSVRPNRTGGQTATLAIKRELARDFIRIGYVRIGWASCPIRARVSITRCYKCLAFDHRTMECQGEDRTKVCLKCGKEDHRAKECKNNSFCLTCKVEGHRADQTRCPMFRKLVREKSKTATTGQKIRQTSTTTENEY